MAQEIADSTLLDTWASSGLIVEPDISKIIEGWQLGEQPPHEYMNWLQNTFGSKLNHILKNGVASWNNETEYLAGSSVQYNGNVWLCKTTNTNSTPTDVNANWKRIITIEALTTVLGGYVKNTGDQSIDGIKTFVKSPIVPTPTTGTQSVNKDYVDLKISTNQIFDKPNKGALFIKVSPSSIKIPTGFKVGVGAESFKLSTDYTLSLATNLIIPETKTAGTDYYVYATSTGTFYISSNENISIDRLIGGFHYGLTGETEAPTGNKTEDDMVKIRGINQYSFWDLKYRPVASTKGMVNIGKRWYDIYLLNSEHITNGTSKAGLFIAAGATTNGRAIPKIPLEYGGNGTITYGKFTWFQACEIGKAHNKEMISYAEFPTITYGVNEQKSSQTNAYETVVGKIEHYPNLTSKYGIEQATGVEWIWGSDVQGIGGTAWLTGVTDNRGDIYAPSNTPTAVLLGGARDAGVHAGSRASSWLHFVWHSLWDNGCRFACDHLELE